jgi:hypothetical protein
MTQPYWPGTTVHTVICLRWLTNIDGSRTSQSQDPTVAETS